MTPHAADSLAPTSSHQPSTGRRTLLKGAAWSVPVVAASAVVPARASATPTLGSVTLSSGCLAGVVGLNLLPGFLVAETPSGVAPPTLTFTQVVRMQGTYSYLTIGGTLADEAARIDALLISRPLFDLYFGVNLLETKGPGVTTTPFAPTDAAYEETGRGSGGSGTTLVTYTLTRSRSVTVSNLAANNRTGIGYLLNANISILGQITNTMTVNPEYVSYITGPTSATVTSTILSLNCGG